MSHHLISVRMAVSTRERNNIPKKKKCKKAKWLSQEALQIAKERGEAKSKGERKRFTQPNMEFPRTRGDKKGFFSEQCKETEEDNRRGTTRDLNKVRNTKGTPHPEVGTTKDRNGTDLREAEETEEVE